MKNLKDLKGIKVLTKPEQKFITGGLKCKADGTCPPDYYPVFFGYGCRCLPYM